MPSPSWRWRSFWLTTELVAGGIARAELTEKIEHARVGGPAGQGGDGVAGPGLAQIPQQPGDGAGVAEAGLGGGVAVQQGGDGVAGPGRAQRLQQPGDALRVAEAGLGGGVAVQQGGDRVAGRGV